MEYEKSVLIENIMSLIMELSDEEVSDVWELFIAKGYFNEQLPNDLQDSETP